MFQPDFLIPWVVVKSQCIQHFRQKTVLDLTEPPLRGHSRPGNNKPVAENIDVLNFVYLREDGTTANDVSEIRSIQITMVARSSKVDSRYKDTAVYINQQGTAVLGPKNDHFRRKLLTTQVCCRNLAF